MLLRSGFVAGKPIITALAVPFSMLGDTPTTDRSTDTTMIQYDDNIPGLLDPRILPRNDDNIPGLLDPKNCFRLFLFTDGNKKGR